jgi:hypothetical protein
LPVTTDCDAGVADNEKSGGPVTLKVTFAVWVSAPLMPVMVSTYEPTAAVPLLTFRVEVPVVGLGVKLADAPAGSPVRLSVTDPAKPFWGVSVTV